MSLADLFGGELRAHFPESKSVGEIDGAPTPLTAISVRSMNFGQHWRTPGMSEVGYRLHLPAAFFLSHLQQEDAYAEIVEDARKHPGASPLDVALLSAGYPTIAAALNQPTLAAQLALFFAHDLLVRWLGDGPPAQEPGFVLNSIDDVELRTGDLLIQGRGRRSATGTQYQDV